MDPGPLQRGCVRGPESHVRKAHFGSMSPFHEAASLKWLLSALVPLKADFQSKCSAVSG